MDASVLAALARWPNVPAVYGWLSLDARGRWRVHPEGDAHQQPVALGQTLGQMLGQTIGNAGLRAFIDRNYGCDARGQWFFQNGPQRVYVRLDAAPYIVRLAEEGLALQTHTGRSLADIRQWLVDEAGNLYLASDLGAGRVDDRDLAAILAHARGLEALEQGASQGTLVWQDGPDALRAPWQRVAAHEIPRRLGFVACPRPVAAAAPARG